MSFDRTIEALEFIENRQVNFLMEEIWNSNSTIIWNLGIGEKSGMLGFLQRLTEKALKKKIDFEYIIHLPIPFILEDIYEWDQKDLNKIYKKVLHAVADALNLMDNDNSKLRKLEAEVEKEAYYSYNQVNEQKELELINQMRAEIYQTLKGKRYLLVTEELCLPITDPRIAWLMEGWLPGNFIPNRAWNDSCWWLITFSDRERYNKCKNQGGFLLDLSDLIERYDQVFSPLFLLNQEFSMVAKSISSKYGMEMTHIMDILWSCILYTNFLKPERDEQKELIQMWFAEGLLSQGIKFKHVGRASLSEELNVLISCDKEGGEESEKKDNLANDQNFQLFGLAEMILEAITSCSLIGPKLGKGSTISFPGLQRLLGKLKSLDKGYNKNLNPSLSDRYEFGKVENITSDPKKWINKTWISMNVTPWESDNWVKWMLHPKSNNTTTFVLRCLKPFKSIDELFCNMSYLRVLKLTGSSIEYLPELLSGFTNLRLLSLRNCNNLKSLGTVSSSASSPIGSLERLEVLDLVGIPLTEIPDDLGNKKHQIYFLRISNLEITHFPLSLFNDMSNLRELVLDGCKSLTRVGPLVSLTNLEALSLSNTKLVSLPPDTFEKMQHLRVLKLIDNPLLETVPKSLSDAQMLEELELRYCSGLKKIDALPIKNLKLFIFNHIYYDGDVGFWYDYYNHWIQSLPESLSRSYNLREVKISGCTSLKVIKINGNISIRSFSLSDSAIISLSLYGCRELVKIDLIELHELEELNLSGTAITEIPDISRFPRLRQLDLQAVSHLRRAPWHEFDHIPEVFNLDQCDFTDTAISDIDAHGNFNQRKLSPEIMARICICVRDSHLFLNLDHKHCTYLLEKGYLQSFYILVASCEKMKEALGTSLSQTIQFQPFEWSCYKDARLKALAPNSSQVQQLRYSRHVEISSTECYPFCLKGILEITESLSVKDNIHISSVSDLNPRVPKLLALQIQGCHKIQGLFKATYGKQMGPLLQDLHVTHLDNMTTLLIEKEIHFRQADFGSLKHLNLSCCLKLESIFPNNIFLPSLETLMITDCTMLETVFYKSSYYDLDVDLVSEKELKQNHLRSLHTMRLHYLPQLQHIYKEQRVGALLMPKWRTLFFRDCWSLRQLPLLTGSCDQKVYVDGENKKCNTIKELMDTEQLSRYEFKSQPLVASLKDEVKNRIFLK